MRYSLFIILSIMFVACQSIQPTSEKSLDQAAYDEDLSLHRVQFDAKLDMEKDTSCDALFVDCKELAKESYDATTQIDDFVDTIRTKNMRRGFIPGYTIQVYTGYSREEAAEARKKVYGVLPELTPDILYMQPTFKVRVGEFRNRLDAQKHYELLSPQFSNPVILPIRISIK